MPALYAYQTSSSLVVNGEKTPPSSDTVRSIWTSWATFAPSDALGGVTVERGALRRGPGEESSEAVEHETPMEG